MVVGPAEAPRWGAGRADEAGWGPLEQSPAMLGAGDHLPKIVGPAGPRHGPRHPCARFPPGPCFARCDVQRAGWSPVEISPAMLLSRSIETWRVVSPLADDEPLFLQHRTASSPPLPGCGLGLLATHSPYSRDPGYRCRLIGSCHIVPIRSRYDLEGLRKFDVNPTKGGPSMSTSYSPLSGLGLETEKVSSTVREVPLLGESDAVREKQQGGPSGDGQVGADGEALEEQVRDDDPPPVQLGKRAGKLD